MGEPFNGAGISHFDVFKTVTGSTDPLVTNFGCSEVKGVQRRVQAGVANHMESALDAEQRAGSQMRGGLFHGKVQGAALPP